MKKLLFMVAILISATIHAQDNADFKAQTIEFIKSTGAVSTFDDVIAQVGTMVSEAKKEAYKKEADATLDKLYSDLADVYMKEFTPEEVEELNKFYDTELGKKLASKQTTLTQKGMMIGQTWGMKLQQIAQNTCNKSQIR